MTVFKYINKKDNSLIGYHLSTMCQVGSLEHAKRYNCETPEQIAKQQETIQTNFNSVINSTEENQKDSFINLLPIKEHYFPNLTQEDVELQYEEVSDIEVIQKIHTIIDNDGVHKIN